MAVVRLGSLHVLRHRLHFVWGQVTNVTAINLVQVFEEVCTGHSLVTKRVHVQG